MEKKLNDALSRAIGTREDTITRINSSEKINLESIEEIDHESCIRLRVFPNMSDSLNSLPSDQAEAFIALLGSGGKFEINDTLWISTKSYLPKKEFFEITAIIPRKGSFDVADFVRVSTINQYNFNQPIFVREIIIPKEAKEVSCIKPD
jgi:hypothetical protein